MLSSLVVGFPRGRCRELLECRRCHLKSPMLWSWEQQSYPRATWAHIEDNHIKRRPWPSTHLEAEVFSQLSRIRVQLIRQTGRPVVVRMFQGRLIVAGYHSRHPDQCPSLNRTSTTIKQSWTKPYAYFMGCTTFAPMTPLDLNDLYYWLGVHFCPSSN